MNEQTANNRSTTKYSYSTNAERFFGQCDSRGDAIREAIEEIYSEDIPSIALERGFDVGQCVAPGIVTNVADMVLEHIYENASGEYGDCAEGWLDGKDLIKKLDELLEPIIDKFIKENDPPTFYGLANVESLLVKDFPEIYKEILEENDGKNE